MAILVVVVLVLPKMSQVSDAKKKLEEARTHARATLSHSAALCGRQESQRARGAATDRRKVDRLIPPTADLPGLILLLRNSADS